MSYSAEISRLHPTMFLFLLDQSGSMAETIPDGRSKAQFLADVLNQTLYELVTRCNKADGVRDYFEIGVLCYHADRVYSGFQFSRPGHFIHPISEIADHPLRVESVSAATVNNDGEVFAEPMMMPIWIEPTAAGNTPMSAAFREAAYLTQDWCDRHADSFPPTVVHVSDGMPTDGSPAQAAELLRQLSTDDGPALLFNCHVSSSGGAPLLFPDRGEALPDDHARLLFAISSPFPDHLREQARRRKYELTASSRFCMYQASPNHVVRFFDLGTRPATLR